MVIIAMLLSVITASAQTSMKDLIQQSMAKVDGQPESFLTCATELQRIEAMYPDSLGPKVQRATMLFVYAVRNPQGEKTAQTLKDADQTVTALKPLVKTNADQSALHTLQAFSSICRIVQNPMVNGPRYYMEVFNHLDTALKLNPDNEMAKMLKQQMQQGMNGQ